MRLRYVLLAVLAPLAVGATANASTRSAAASARLPAFASSIRPIDPVTRRLMTGRSWHRGCPVALRDLRVLTLRYVRFNGTPAFGKLVVHRTVARKIVSVFRALYAARFPIRRMRLVDAYGADDFASIEADNTSAFNCRRATGSSHWSQHAYGLAVDVDPIENPYVVGGRTEHRASRPYVRRVPRKGVILRRGPVVRAFARVGWGWGGLWSSPTDYQHFSANGH